MTLSKWPPNSKFQFAYYDVSIFMENWLYLCKYWSIFFQILICSSWDNFLRMQLLLYFILTKASWRIFAVKGGMSVFSHFACILYGTWLFLKTGFYIPVFREQYLCRFSFIYAELRVCCSSDKKLSQMYPLFCLNFLFDLPTYTCSKQVLQI